MFDKKKVDDTLSYYNFKAKDFVSGTVDVAFTGIQDIFLEYIPLGGKFLISVVVSGAIQSIS